MKQAGHNPEIVFSPASEQGAYDTARVLFDDEDPPTAVFAGHDTLALGVLRAIADRGWTVDDVSVVGYDNIDLAGHPLISLTTVDQFGVEMGRTAIDLLMERIRDNRTSPKHHRTKPQLRVRNSSRPPRSSGSS